MLCGRCWIPATLVQISPRFLSVHQAANGYLALHWGGGMQREKELAILPCNAVNQENATPCAPNLVLSMEFTFNYLKVKDLADQS